MGIPAEEITSEFRAGRFSLATQLLPEDVRSLRHDSAVAAGFVESPGLSTAFIQFNTKQGPLADLDVRKALSRVLDSEALVRHLATRMAAVADGLVPPALLRAVSTRRPSRVGTPVRAAIPEGLKLRGAVLPLRSGLHGKAGRWVCAQLEQAGVEVELVGSTMPEFLELLQSGEADFLLGRWRAEYPDVDSFLHGLFHTKSGVLRRFFSSDVLDAAVARGRQESDPDERDAFYRQFLGTITRRAALVPLYYERQYRFALPNVAGLHLRLAQPMVSYEELRID